MREFFRGWRRKMGLLMLLMAFAICCVWARSPIYRDRIELAAFSQSWEIVSSDGRINCIHWPSSDPDWGASWGTPSKWRYLHDPTRVDWQFSLLDETPIWCWSSPHWMIISLLTIDAACLILWKQQGIPREYLEE